MGFLPGFLPYSSVRMLWPSLSADAWRSHTRVRKKTRICKHTHKHTCKCVHLSSNHAHAQTHTHTHTCRGLPQPKKLAHAHAQTRALTRQHACAHTEPSLSRESSHTHVHTRTHAESQPSARRAYRGLNPARHSPQHEAWEGRGRRWRAGGARSSGAPTPCR